MTTRARAILPPILWVLLAILALRFAIFAAGVAERRTDGFAGYYTSARLLRQGVAVERFYDDAWFGARVTEDSPGVREVYWINPPTAALLLLPLARFSYARARLIWTIFSLVLLVGASVWIAREARLGRVLTPAFFCLILVSQPVWASFHQGQAYVFLLFLLVAVWYGYRRDRPALLGIALGAALVLKLAGVLLLPLLLVQWRRRWRAAAWTIGSAAMIWLLSLPWLGLVAWERYTHNVLALRSEPDLAVTAYQTVPGVIRHLTAPDAVWNPGPLIAAPEFGRLLQLVVVLAIVAGSLYFATRADARSDLAFAVALIATMVISPVALDYHYVLLLLPAAILVVWAWERGTVLPWLVLLLGIALIVADLPYRSPALRDGLWSMLAYPKLAGALLLWGLGLYAIGQPEEVPDEDRARAAGLQRQRA